MIDRWMDGWIERMTIITELNNRKEEKEISRVLWVDDNPQNNKNVILDLQDRGIIVDLAITTEQALELYEKNIYSTLITDTARGKKYDAGYQLCRILFDRHNVIPILVYSTEDTIVKYGDMFKPLGVSFMTSDCFALRKKIYSIVGIDE